MQMLRKREVTRDDKLALTTKSNLRGKWQKNQSSSWPVLRQQSTKASSNEVIYNNVKEHRIVHFHEAPEFLRSNPYIRQGYRVNLCKKTCLKSVFWWTNETLNVWTHLLGWIYFAYLTVHEILEAYNSFGSSFWFDSAISILILVCFQICMAASAGYHTFCCHSADSYTCWLSYDLSGISFSLMAIYTTGIYYAFWCQPVARNTYMTVSFTYFLLALAVQSSPKSITEKFQELRMVFFVSWGCFGFIPTTHWVWQNGGFSAQYVVDFVTQIVGIYIIIAAALVVYVTKVPEKWFPGCVDYIGSSHQLWHVLVFFALWYWRGTSEYFANYRFNHGCFEEALLSVMKAGNSSAAY